MRTRFCVWLWWMARQWALARLREDFSSDYRDAQRAWERGAVLTGDLASPQWNTRGLAADLALHDAADSLLGEQA